ncbi:hypothetical protein HN873_035722 [Arachis hypogaea]
MVLMQNLKKKASQRFPTCPNSYQLPDVLYSFQMAGGLDLMLVLYTLMGHLISSMMGTLGYLRRLGSSEIFFLLVSTQTRL